MTAPLPDNSDISGRITAPRRSPWLIYLSLAVVAGVVLFYRLGEFRTLGSHEVYAAVPAREMLQSGNWIVPRFGQLPRLEKPPLAYWVLAGSASLFGGISEWSVRLPAAVSALLLSLLMGLWATRWYGRNAGIAATLVQMTAVYVVIFARKAEVDMLLCLMTTSALFLVANQNADEARRKTFLRWIGIYLLVSLTWMAKFHYGPAMILAPAIGYLILQQRYRQLLHLANPIGLLMLAAAVVTWPYLLLQQVPEAWNVWQGETVGRAVGELGREPIWYYLPHTLWLILPWTPFALATIPASWRQAWMRGPARDSYFGIRLWKEGDARERFLWIWFLVVLAIVTVSANKHKHYIMAALPMFSLLAARSLAIFAEGISKPKLFLSRLIAIGLVVIFLLSGLGAAVGITSQWPELSTPAFVIAALLAGGGSLMTWLIHGQRNVAATYTWAIVFLGCYMVAIGWIIPGRDHRLATVRFAKEIRSQLPTGEEIGVYNVGMKPIVYHLHDPVYRVESLAAVKEQLERRRRMLLVAYEDRLAELADIGRQRVVKQMAFPDDLPAPKHAPLVLIELTTPKSTVAVKPESKKRTR